MPCAADLNPRSEGDWSRRLQAQGPYGLQVLLKASKKYSKKVSKERLEKGLEL